MWTQICPLSPGITPKGHCPTCFKTSSGPSEPGDFTLWQWLLLQNSHPKAFLSLSSPSTGAHRSCTPLTELQALALSTLDSLLMSVLKTFIFSTRHVRAVSVASPTFS